MLTEYGYLESKPCTTPMDLKLNFSTKDGSLLENPSDYRKIVEKLFYLTITRSDISYTVQTLSQYLSNPTNVYLSDVHRLLRYLNP